MMTINILMRNANELTSTSYKSYSHTEATSLQFRPEKHELLAGESFLSFFAVSPKNDDDAQRKNDLFCIMNKEATMAIEL